MKIILYKDVPNLGEEGDIKVVANGYARNYLLPNKLAVPYSRVTEIELEQKMNSISRRRQEKLSEATSLKDKVEALSVEMSASVGEKGKLFGSITATMIVDYLSSIGLDIERKKIEIPENGIKNVGDYVVKVKVYGGQTADLKLKVIPQKPLATEKEPDDNEDRPSSK